MGACYDVQLKMRFNDTKNAQEKAVAALQAYITEHDGKGILFGLDRFEKDGITPDSLEGLLKIFLCGSNYWHPELKYGRKWIHYYNGFDASYGWESVMMDMFETIAPYLAEKSEIKIWPDEDYDHMVIKNGKCKQVH